MSQPDQTTPLQEPEEPAAEATSAPPPDVPETSSRRRRAGRFERFTPRARHALALAEEETRRTGHAEIRPEHLLLGVLREGTGLAIVILQRAGLDLDELRADAERRLGRGEGTPPERMPLSEACQRALRLAVEESERLQLRFVGTEHLLVGLLREGGSLDPAVLTDFALGTLLRGTYGFVTTPRRAREATSAMPSFTGYRMAASATRDNVLSIRVGDDDLAAVDALVEIGIARSRSEAAAWLLGSGVMANRSLFERAQSVISEVRRLRDEAQQIAQEHALSGQPTPEPPTAPPEERSEATG
jgi:hypothetical protein